jgi:hypothetical protein
LKECFRGDFGPVNLILVMVKLNEGK